MSDDDDVAWIEELPSLIGAIGERSLGLRLLALLNKSYDADHAVVFHLHDGQLDEVAAASIDGSDAAKRQARRYLSDQVWRCDPTLSKAESLLLQNRLALLRTDIAGLDDRRLREDVYGVTGIEDRILICGRIDGGIVGLSVLRSRGGGMFSDRQLESFRGSGETLLAVVAKHVEIFSKSPDVSIALTSLGEIEACIAAAPEAFPRREAEVCSRIIYGMSTIGIALELEISEETVMTYRKRAYHRIGIATQRELLLWYLKHWNEWTRMDRRGIAV